jgi:hypothetical protein
MLVLIGGGGEGEGEGEGKSDSDRGASLGLLLSLAGYGTTVPIESGMLPPGRNLTALAGVWMTPRPSLARPSWRCPSLPRFASGKPDRASERTGIAHLRAPKANGERCSAAIDSPAQRGTAGGIAARVPQVTAPYAAVRCGRRLGGPASTMHFSFAV